MTNNTPAPTDIGRVITSTSARKIIYGVYVVGVVLIGAAQVAYAALQLGQPDWLTVALAVSAYLGLPVGTLALANTPSKVEELPDVQH